MSLFIANPTKQVNDLWYHIPENPRQQSEIIPAGGQVELAKHLNPTRAQLEGILEQLSSHGLVSINDVKRIKTGKVSLVYSWDKPVDLDTINNGLILNDEAALIVADDARLDQTAAIIDDLSSKVGAEPETADVIVSEVDRAGGKAKTTVVRSVGKGKG